MCCVQQFLNPRDILIEQATSSIHECSAHVPSALENHTIGEQHHSSRQLY
uniref:Uncharacterized protein n=1 Tax=Arundo donax TaxID=35708 RepID=A0A0A9TQR2_ARUDO